MRCLGDVLSNGDLLSIWGEWPSVLASARVLKGSPWDPLANQFKWIQSSPTTESLFCLQKMASSDFVSSITTSPHEGHHHTFQGISITPVSTYIPPKLPNFSYLSLSSLPLPPSIPYPPTRSLLLLFPPNAPSHPSKSILFFFPREIYEFPQRPYFYLTSQESWVVVWLAST